MKRHLFLSGPAFSGKSRLIQGRLGVGLQSAGGFCTVLETAADGSMKGCTLMPAAMAGGVEGLEKQMFLDFSSFPPAHDSEVFRELGVRLLEEAEWYPFAVLDEIGGIDLIIPQFRNTLDALLCSDLPIIGAVKTREASEQMRQMLGPGAKYTAFYDRLYDILAEDPETEIISIEENTEAEAGAAVDEWIAEYAALPAL